MLKITSNVNNDGMFFRDILVEPYRLYLEVNRYDNSILNLQEDSELSNSWSAAYLRLPGVGVGEKLISITHNEYQNEQDILDYGHSMSGTGYIRVDFETGGKLRRYEVVGNQDSGIFTYADYYYDIVKCSICGKVECFCVPCTCGCGLSIEHCSTKCPVCDKHPAWCKCAEGHCDRCNAEQDIETGGCSCETYNIWDEVYGGPFYDYICPRCGAPDGHCDCNC